MNTTSDEPHCVYSLEDDKVVTGMILKEIKEIGEFKFAMKYFMGESTLKHYGFELTEAEAETIKLLNKL